MTIDETATLETAPAFSGAAIQLPNGAEGIEKIAELARAAVRGGFGRIDDIDHPGLPHKIIVRYDPKTGDFRSVKHLLEEWREHPERRRGTARANTLASFIDLTNRHKSHHSVIFAASMAETPNLTAIINYHKTDGTADNGDHRVAYQFPLTDEVKVWLGQNGKSVSQADLVMFLEEHAAELASPTAEERARYEPLFKERFAEPNDLVSLARSLEIHTNSKAKVVTRPASGERIVEFSEEHVNNKGERIEIPGIFMISVAAFVDGEAVRVPARLRYRVSGGDINWSYHLYRVREAIRDRVRADMARVAEETFLPAYEGSPES